MSTKSNGSHASRIVASFVNKTKNIIVYYSLRILIDVVDFLRYV
jgi:hypothetical protein